MEKQTKSKYFHSKDFRNLVDDIIRNNGPYSGVFTVEDILYYNWYWRQKEIIFDYFLIPILIDEMFKFVGHPEINFDYVLKHPYINYMDWYTNWNWTISQHEEFENKVVRPILKKLRPRASNHYLDNNCAWFNVNYGLTYLSNEEMEERRKNNKQKAIDLCNEYNRTLDEFNDLQIKFLRKEIRDYPERVFLKEKYNINEKVYSELNSLYKYDIKEIKNALDENPNLIQDIENKLKQKEEELRKKMEEIRNNPESFDIFK